METIIHNRKKLIERSKNFCSSCGLDRSKNYLGRRLSSEEIGKRQRELQTYINSALPLMNFCSETFKLCGSIVVLTDKEGYVLKAVGPLSVLKTRSKIGLIEGVSLQEKDAGTNAVALCLKYKIPFYVSGKEYYLKIFQNGSCFSAPIFYKRELLGAVVIVHPQKKGHPHTFALVQILAKLIEEEYKKLIECDFLISLVNTLNVIMVVTEQDGFIRWLSPKATSFLKLESGENILHTFDQKILRPGTIINEIFESERLEKSFLVVRKEYNDKFLFILEPITEAKNKRKINLFGANYTFDDIVGIEKIKTRARHLAGQDTNLLLFGESGTGKELLASAIHNSSARAGERFVVVNCAAIPETLFESELFGYRKGAFTDARYDKIGKIEYANQGTLFFDEIAELPIDVQAKLLRVLEDKRVIPLGSNEERVVNVRFIFATNQNLEELVKQGKFREDLYYRIHSPVIKIPPLRERREEIPDLIEHLLQKIRNNHKGFIAGLTERAKKCLMNYDFPGNVRELEGILKQAFFTCRKEYIDVEDLGLEYARPLSIEEKVRQYKAKLVYECFVTNKKDIKKTCSLLNLSERQLYRYLKMIKENRNQGEPYLSF